MTPYKTARNFYWTAQLNDEIISELLEGKKLRDALYKVCRRDRYKKRFTTRTENGKILIKRIQ